jgi:hypothetical protein
MMRSEHQGRFDKKQEDFTHIRSRRDASCVKGYCTIPKLLSPWCIQAPAGRGERMAWERSSRSSGEKQMD